MIRAALCALVLCVAAPVAVAQTVTVRSGEHQGFTRLVMILPGRPGWRLEPRDRGMSVIFDVPGAVFDTADVFRRIGRGRLAEIDAPAGQSRLDLGFGCDCETRTFWQGDATLVIDIAERTPGAPASAALRPRLRPRDAGAESLAGPSDSHSSAPPVGLPNPEPAQVTLSAAAAAEPFGPFAGAVPPPARIPEFDPEELRRGLLRELGQAAGQGLLVPRRGRTGASGHGRPERAAEVSLSRASAGGDARGAEHSAPSPDALSNVRIARGAERDPGPGARDRSGTGDHPACLPADWADVETWGSEMPFHAQVGPLNRWLVAEFDRPESQTILDLARLYVYFGFGLEAVQVLSLLEDMPDEAGIVTELARLMDDGPGEEASVLGSQIACDTPAALWGLVATDPLPRDLVFDHDLVLRHFSALPLHLRQHHGPGLARRLAATGHGRSAEAVLRIVDRAGADQRPEAGLARAELEHRAGRADSAENALKAVVRSHSPVSAEALLLLVEKRLSAGLPVDADQALLAGGHVQEHRGTPLGRRLARGYVPALAAAGDFERAFSELDRLRPELAPADLGAIRRDLARYVILAADDLDFLRYMLADRAEARSTLEADLGIAAARRLLRLGFPDAAGRYVAAPPDGQRSVTVRQLRAEIALAEQRPRDAEIELIGMKGPEADLLRARARSDAGEHAAAVSLFTAGQQPERAAAAALRARDWERARDAEETVAREVAELMLDAVQGSADPQAGVLARNRALLDQSARARATLERLLAARPMPEPPED